MSQKHFKIAFWKDLTQSQLRSSKFKILNLAHKPSFMSYHLHICLEQNHIVWLPSIKLGAVMQSSPKPVEAVRNSYVLEMRQVQGDIKIWKDAVEITRSLPVSSLCSSFWQPKREGKGLKAVQGHFSFLPDVTGRIHLQWNSHSCYSLPYIFKAYTEGKIQKRQWNEWKLHHKPLTPWTLICVCVFLTLQCSTWNSLLYCK